MRSTKLKVALYLFKFVSVKSFLSFLTLRALYVDGHAWVTPALIENIGLLASASLAPWLVLVWLLDLGYHQGLIATWNLLGLSTATALALYLPAYAWCPIVVACTLNTIHPNPRWSLTNLCLGFLACTVWLELCPLGYSLGVLVAMEVEGFVAAIQYRKHLRDA